MRSSYKPAFEGDFELMAPELDKSMIRKWLRNIGDTSDKPKLKDFWEKQLVTLQRELKDVFEPLIYLLNSVPAGNHAEMPLVVANRLLGHVFAHITQMRRTNVMRHVAPKFSNMVDDPMLFSSRDHRHLFGERFITALDKEADLDAKMDKIGRYGGHNTSRRGNYQNRRGDYQSGGSRGGYNNNSNNSNNFKKPNWNWGKQQQQGKQGSAANTNKYVEFSFPTPLNNNTSCVGGRLALFYDAWRLITNDQWVLDIIKSGYRIEFTQTPFHPLKSKWIQKNQQFVTLKSRLYLLKAQLLLLPIRTVSLAIFFVAPKKLRANLD